MSSKKVTLVIPEVPIMGIHTFKAALMTYCANSQKLIDELMLPGHSGAVSASLAFMRLELIQAHECLLALNSAEVTS
jgi:hypothetical protein